MSISLAPKNFFIHSPLLISAVLILSVEFQRILNRNPNAPVLSSGMVKDWVAKGSNSKMQEYARLVRADLEIYVGLFITGLIFLGQATLVSLFLYWQMMRLRFMMNVQTQMAFQRLDQKLMVYLNHPYCPGFANKAYTMLKGLLAGLVDTNATQQRVQQNGGGFMGALKSSCQIF